MSLSFGFWYGLGFSFFCDFFLGCRVSVLARLIILGAVLWGRLGVVLGFDLRRLLYLGLWLRLWDPIDTSNLCRYLMKIRRLDEFSNFGTSEVDSVMLE